VVCAALFVAATFFDWVSLLPFRLLDNPATILGLLLAFGYVGLRARYAPFFRMPASLALLYLGATIVSVVVGGEGFEPGWGTRELPFYFQFFQAGILFLIFVDVLRDRRAVVGVVVVFFVACTAMSVLAHLGFDPNVGGGRSYVRVGVKGLNLNEQALRYGLCLLGVFGWSVLRWPRFRLREWVLLACSASMLVALVRTGSRGGLAMLLFGLVLGTLLLLRRARALAYVTLVPVLIASVAYTIFSSPLVRQRIAEVERGRTGLRVELTQSSWEMFKQKPVFGWGTRYVEELGGFVGVERRIAAHNTYMQILLSFGLVGFIPWLLLVGVPGWWLWRWRRHPIVTMVLVVYASALLFALAGNQGYDKVFWILVAFAAVTPALVGAPVATPARARVDAFASPRSRRGGQLPSPVSTSGYYRAPRV